MKNSNTACCWSCDQYKDAKTSEIRVWTDSRPHVICADCRAEAKDISK